MRFDLLKDYNRIQEYAEVCWLAMGDNPGPIAQEFIQEITRYVDNANSDNPIIDRDRGLAFAVFDDKGGIAGTLCANEDRHFTDCLQLNHLAVTPGARGRMYGRILLNKVAESVKKYSGLKYIIGSTVTAGPFYEALRIKKIGEITANGYTRYFYGKEI